MTILGNAGVEVSRKHPRPTRQNGVGPLV